MFILVSLKTLVTNMVCVSTGCSDLHFLVEEDYLGLEEGICLFFNSCSPLCPFAYKQKTF